MFEQDFTIALWCAFHPEKRAEEGKKVILIKPFFNIIGSVSVVDYDAVDTPDSKHVSCYAGMLSFDNTYSRFDDADIEFGRCLFDDKYMLLPSAHRLSNGSVIVVNNDYYVSDYLIFDKYSDEVSSYEFDISGRHLYSLLLKDDILCLFVIGDFKDRQLVFHRVYEAHCEKRVVIPPEYCNSEVDVLYKMIQKDDTTITLAFHMHSVVTFCDYSMINDTWKTKFILNNYILLGMSYVSGWFVCYGLEGEKRTVSIVDDNNNSHSCCVPDANIHTPIMTRLN
jgi:hypothetical protein